MIYVNPGAGPCEVGTWENAYANIKVFLTDCEIPLHIVESEFEVGDDGRYRFVLRSDNFKELRYEIKMPGLPLDRVRYMNEEGQNICDYPRLYVDGSSYVWFYALIDKGEVTDALREKIQEHEDLAEVYRQELDEFLNKDNELPLF